MEKQRRQAYLAVDFGASGGRHIIGTVEKGKLKLQEIYRFSNGPVWRDGLLCWDLEYLWEQLLAGMKRCREMGIIPQTVGIDTWGLDYVLLDGQGKRLGQAVNHRDPRTKGIYEGIYPLVPEAELYARTGIQMAEFNTLCQLVAVKERSPWQLDQAAMLLMMPDYLNYMLTGVCAQEYTNAATTQMLRQGTACWDEELLKRLGLSVSMLLPVQMPGSTLGMLKPEVAEEVGFCCQVMLVPSHDTASAFLASLGSSSSRGAMAAISSGTWSLMGMETEPLVTEESRRLRFTNEGGYGGTNLLLKNSMGLWMIQNIRRENAPELTFSELCRLAEETKISSVVDCSSDDFLAPDSMTEAVRAYCERTGQQVPGSLPELARVVYHSLAVSYGQILREMEKLTGTAFQGLNIIGGGSRADYLNRLTAREAKVRVYAGPSEATAAGNLICQMKAAGLFASVEEARACVAESFEIKTYEP